MGGECSHHCATLASRYESKTVSERNLWKPLDLGVILGYYCRGHCEEIAKYKLVIQEFNAYQMLKKISVRINRVWLKSVYWWLAFLLFFTFNRHHCSFLWWRSFIWWQSGLLFSYSYDFFAGAYLELLWPDSSAGMCLCNKIKQRVLSKNVKDSVIDVNVFQRHNRLYSKENDIPMVLLKMH